MKRPVHFSVRHGHRPQSGFYYKGILGAIVVGLAFLLVLGMVLSLTLDSPAAHRIVVMYLTAPPEETTSSTTTIFGGGGANGTSTTGGTGGLTTSMSGTTTPASFNVINLTCPMNVARALGSSLEPPATGGYATASDGCTTPIVTYADLTASTILRGPKKRSPSFSLGSSELLSVTASWDAMGEAGVDAADADVAAGLDYVVQTRNTPFGALVTVRDKLLAGELGAFLLSTVAPPLTMCSWPGAGEAQIVWDDAAQRWLAAERSTNNSQILCVYASNSSNPLDGAWMTYIAAISAPQYRQPKVGVWGDAYLITVESGVGTNPAVLCVLERSAVLAHALAPGFFCAAPLNGKLPFALRNAWTPIHAHGTPPTAEAQSAGVLGTIGAVFMRPIDDEYEFGTTTTSAVDTIEVEHWYGINFTTSTYNAVRYKANVADFISNVTLVQTPTTVLLDPVHEVVMHRAAFRNVVSLGFQSVIVSLTSGGGDIPVETRWIELRWLPPAPSQNPRWVPYQQGALSGWMPSPAMDAYGSMVLMYAQSSALIYPGLYAAMRLANDPLNGIRQPSIPVRVGEIGAVLDVANNNTWGRHFSVSPDPSSARTFYASGQIATNGGGPWKAVTVRLRMAGEVVQRTWMAQDTCGHVSTCIQLITMA